MSDSISNGTQLKQINVYISPSMLEDNGGDEKWEGSILWMFILRATGTGVGFPIDVQHHALLISTGYCLFKKWAKNTAISQGSLSK